MKFDRLVFCLVVLLIQSCATPQQLIQQNVIYKGMNKSSLWNAMVDMNIADDYFEKVMQKRQVIKEIF